MNNNQLQPIRQAVDVGWDKLVKNQHVLQIFEVL